MKFLNFSKLLFQIFELFFNFLKFSLNFLIFYQKLQKSESNLKELQSSIISTPTKLSCRSSTGPLEVQLKFQPKFPLKLLQFVRKPFNCESMKIPRKAIFVDVVFFKIWEGFEAFLLSLCVPSYRVVGVRKRQRGEDKMMLMCYQSIYMIKGFFKEIWPILRVIEWRLMLNIFECQFSALFIWDIFLQRWGLLSNFSFCLCLQSQSMEEFTENQIRQEKPLMQNIFNKIVIKGQTIKRRPLNQKLHALTFHLPILFTSSMTNWI